MHCPAAAVFGVKRVPGHPLHRIQCVPIKLFFEISGPAGTDFEGHNRFPITAARVLCVSLGCVHVLLPKGN